MGLWDWDLRTGRVYFDPLWRRQLGIGEHEALDGVEAWYERVHPEDVGRVRRTLSATHAQELDGPLRLEYRMRHRIGSYRHIRCVAIGDRDARGQVVRLLGSHEDITETKVAELRSLRQRGQLAACIEHCPLPVAMFDTDMRYLAASAKWRDHYRLSPSIIGRSHYEVFPEMPERWKEVHRRSLGGEQQRSEEDHFVRPDGTIEWLRWEVHPWRVSSEVGGIVIFAELLTDQRRAQATLRKSEERLRLAIQGAKLGTWHWNLQTKQIEASDECFALFGLRRGTTPSYENVLACIKQSDRARVREAILQALESEGEFQISFRCQRPEGSTVWLSCRGRTFPASDGSAATMEGVVIDITRHKEAEIVLRESEAQLRSVADAVPHLVSQIAPDGHYIYTNKRWRDYFSRDSSLDRDLVAPTLWADALHPDDARRVVDAWNRIVRKEQRETTYEIRLRGRSGDYQWFTARAVPVFDGAGKLLYVIATATNVDEVKRVEEALKESEERLHTALRAGGIGTCIWEIAENLMIVDTPLLDLLGRKRTEIDHTAPTTYLAMVHPEEREHIRSVIMALLKHGEELDLETRLLRADGKCMNVSLKGRVERYQNGRARRITAAVVDVTRHKQLEEELRQAQKLEEIGQLAGGVAHDFNNILTIILAQASLLGSRKDLSPRNASSVTEIERAAERAAGLTAQLLAFGRRSMMQLRNVDLNQVVIDALRLLTPSLRENVVLHFEPAPAAIVVRADTNMITQVILNLAINARDAMPSGGHLDIRTSVELDDDATAEEGSAPPSWATLTVSDSGSGIGPDVLPHVFEPFFTTKGVGEGSGLGLPTVYGIVKQHHGVVSVDTALGRGTTIKVMLPLVQAATPRPANLAHEARVRGEGKTVLVVEDEGGVRSVLTNALEQQGYRVLQAADGHEALKISRETQEAIDVLVTDVVMPGGLSGPQVAELIHRERPTIKTILSSGYSQEVVAQGLQAGSIFLPKPYGPARLLIAVEEALQSASTQM